MENLLSWIGHVQFLLIILSVVVTFWFSETKWKYLIIIFSWHIVVVTSFLLQQPILGLLALLNCYLSVKGYNRYREKIREAKKYEDI